MAWGYSSIPICKALAETTKGISHILDPFQIYTYQGIALNLLKDFDLTKFFVFYEQASDIGMAKLYENKTKIQFGFIDGDHRIDAVFIDFYYINKMLEPGGLVVFDDYQFSSVEAVSKYVLVNFHYKVIEQPHKRFIVLEKVKDDDRPWSFYGSFA